MRTIEKTIKAIKGYDLSFLRERYNETIPEMNDPFDEAEKEFKAFMSLIALQDKPIAVTNRSVDHLWHLFIIHTKIYAEFCHNVFGEFIHHQPHSKRFPVPLTAISDVFEAYKLYIGDIPQSWFGDPRLSREAVEKGIYPRDLETNGQVGREGSRNSFNSFGMSLKHFTKCSILII